MISKVYVTTNGCVEGQLSTTYLEQFFKRNGVEVTKDLSKADTVFFWGCGLTEKREKDSVMDIKDIKRRMKPNAKLIAWGCLPRINPKALSTVYAGPIVGADDKAFFEGLLEKIIVPFDVMDIAGAQNRLAPTETCVQSQGRGADAFTDAFTLFKEDWDRLWARSRKNVNYFIRIASGCTGHCSYCSELCVFGRIKSRPTANILSDFKRGLEHGYNRFSLIATDVGAYGKDMGCTLADLLDKMIHVEDRKDYKIILNQVNPFYLREMFPDMEKVFSSGKIATLNCPVQSGSQRILKMMGRPHSAKDWKEDMATISKRFPNIRLSTHFMVGFPTETDQDFNETLNLLDYPVFLDRIIIFKFSGRPQTYATRIAGQVSDQTKEFRTRKLLQKYVRSYALNYPIKLARSVFE
jgi:MiaB/RimO family radical SAM methylthiotransferase